MKNQYFGDINDYRKYGLLRILIGPGKMSAAVCWMLTPGDGRTHGRFVKYLEQPERWRHFDPWLYDRLRDTVAVNGIRNVKLAHRMELVPACRYYDTTLPDKQEARSVYFRDFWDFAKGCDLMFFDPDNGIEVKSVPCGRKYSSKYLYWSELIHGVSEGYSVMVYQHFPFEKREKFIGRMTREILSRTGASLVYWFRTPFVVFFLVPSVSNQINFEQSIFRLRETWGNQIRVGQH